MSNTRSKQVAQQKINVGIYGDTRAGKTRFLYELLSHWSRNHRILWMSEMASRFLESVAIDIEQQGEPSPTSSQTDGIEVDVRLSSETRLHLVLRDLRGGELAGQIDTILDRNAGHPSDGLQTQVKHYDAFLFFFDPTAAKTPDNRSGHFEREHKRAALFAEYVHHRRQNRHLPIVFVATRQDLLQDDADALAESQAWLRRTCQQLRQDYEGRLGGHYPASLVRPNLVAVGVASTPRGNTEEVIEKLAELVDDVRAFGRKDRVRVVRGIALSILVMALVAAVTGVLYWAVGGYRPTPPLAGHIATQETAPQTPAAVAHRLSEIESFLQRMPPENLALDADRATTLRNHLQWMLAAKETGEVAAMDAGDDQHLARRLDDLLSRSSAAVLQSSLSAPATQESIEVLAACLSELPRISDPPEDLSRSYQRFWELYRSYVSQQLGTLLRNQYEAGSQPIQILHKLTDRIDRFVQDVKLSRVQNIELLPRVALEGGAALSSELAVASQYCKNLLDNRGCMAKLTVTSAAYQSKYGVTPTTRRLVFHSQRQTSPLTVRLRPTAIAETPGSARCQFDISPDTAEDVGLALGSLGTLTLAILLKESQIWEDVRTVDLRDLPSEGTSLAILGLPLVLKDETHVLHALPLPEGYEIEVEFSGWHPPPRLLWDAVDVAEGDGTSGNAPTTAAGVP